MTQRSSNGSNRSQFGEYRPETKEEQIARANEYGPANETVLEQLAAYAEFQADAGEWHYGHVTAQRLRLLAQTLEQQPNIGHEERERLHRTIADLTQQVDEANQAEPDSGPVELVIRFSNDGPGTVQIGELHVMVSLLAGLEEGEGGVTG